MDLTTNFGKTVREIRKTLNISQEKLASIAGVNRSHMGEIERGQKSPSLITVERIAIALSCSPSILVSNNVDE